MSTAPPVIVHSAIDAVVNQAHTDAITAYNALAIQGTGTVLPDVWRQSECLLRESILLLRVRPICRLRQP